MSDKKFPKSQVPIRKTVDLLPEVFKTEANSKFMSAVMDPLIQPGVLEKTVGYIGRRYGKTYKSKDQYLDTDNTLRSRYQLEPGVIFKNQNRIEKFYDYLDFKNQLRFFGNTNERDDLITEQTHYTWDPPIDWDKFVNFREYFWEPSGPLSLPIVGVFGTLLSTYSVSLGMDDTWIFSPDGLTNNPEIVLYRGHTYKFNVTAPLEGFSIRKNYDRNAIAYNSNFSYRKGSVVSYDRKFWEAQTDLDPRPGFIITESSFEWKLLGLETVESVLDYNTGVENNNLENGTLTFTVPYDAPDILFYQSLVNPDRFGKFIIQGFESNTKLDIEKEILGKINYTSGNGIEFTNGLIVEFKGQITPLKYSTGTWLVEGVGKSIHLIRFDTLVVPNINKGDRLEVLFDDRGFDTEPFDDATLYPKDKDYLLINRASKDLNPWSRYNRWFHKSVLEYSYKFRGQVYAPSEDSRAKRPIIEFHPNIKLFDHGSISKEPVDFIDTFTDDIFSKIEGSKSYNIDGEFLFDGARILVVADTDKLVNNKIYQVKIVNFNNSLQISLKETDDTVSLPDECVLVKRGKVNAGLMYHYTSAVDENVQRIEKWIKSQEKIKTNQSPLFDVFDENDVSFSDAEKYPVSTFTGSRILAYSQGNSLIDKELGVSLKYLNINNIGDVLFDWEWETQEFTYVFDQKKVTKKISSGFYHIFEQGYSNGWTILDNSYTQPILDSVKISENTSSVTFNTIDWSAGFSDDKSVINFYLNGEKISDSFQRENKTFVFENTKFVSGDIVSLKLISNIDPDRGYYQIPVGLEKNPLNLDLKSFTLGQATDHLISAIEFDRRVEGKILGISNLRDLSGFQKFGNRFLRHASLAPLSLSLICDKEYNLIKALQLSKNSYSEFKNNFLERAIEIDFNDNIPDFVDDIIRDLTLAKTDRSPFADSDMIGSGAYTSIIYNVEDEGIKTFALTQRFTLKELSRRAVYVYKNDSQLLNARDYEFNESFGFVNLNIDLSIGDKIEIREYVSTGNNHIPATPTSMGMYKKYTPMRFVDDTYRDPVEVIQGHDGSITFAYGDFRDDLLLELELRIYNNIKQDYDSKIFDIDNVLGGYYGNSDYDKKSLDEIVVPDFLKYIQNTNINYTINSYIESGDPFTYTYSNMTDPTNTVNLPGWWRGVYQWFYDTDRPHRCPWEMLGFSEMPTWWEEEYGPAPYTSGNLLLWEDMRDGIIRQGPKAGIYNRYKRPTILDHIPVDADGNLENPVDSNLIRNFTLINNKGAFKLGDISPVEYAWRSSSEWPFSLVIGLVLLKPFEFIGTFFDRSIVKENIIGQVVHNNSNNFLTINDLKIPALDQDQSIGLVKYLSCYIKHRGASLSDFKNNLLGIDVNLSSRVSGFVDKIQQRYLLDSKNPASTSSSVFIPPENYDIIFNSSSPIFSLSYSAVIIEKTEGGWIINGYDLIDPYFNYVPSVPNQKDPLISVGGVSETFVEWSSNTNYSNGQIVRYQNNYFRSLRSHTSQENFDSTLYRRLAALPVTGGIQAQRRRNFNFTDIQRLSYGEVLTSVQAVVDFLLGHGEYLKSQGLIFDGYDPEFQTPKDWISSVKEFMFWTQHNWAIGSLISLSPGAQKLKATITVGVVDSLLDGFYEYQVLKADGKTLNPEFINVNRDFQEVTISTVNTTDGIFYLRLYYILKEHVAVFDDRTVFNDIIYDETSGYRQERLKSQGFRTTDWDGDYTSPGFLFDNVTVELWQPFKNYRLGDIVQYRSYNWTAIENHSSTEDFDNTKWQKTDSRLEKQLVANFDYKINQIEDYYSVTSQGIGENQRALARHSIGYQPRKYLQNIVEDSITQFRLYQGFIKEKGTPNVIKKVFNKLNRLSKSGIELNEEWAFKIGQLGGTDQTNEFEFNIFKDKLKVNPQPIVSLRTFPVETAPDDYYRIEESDFIILPKNSLEFLPTALQNKPDRTAGYVKIDHVNYVLKSIDDILNINIDNILENDHVWITFYKESWTVFRFNQLVNIVPISLSIQENKFVSITFNKPHDIIAGDVVGINRVTNLKGFFKIQSVTSTSIRFETVIDEENLPAIDNTFAFYLGKFTNVRISSYEKLDYSVAANLSKGSKLWVDKNKDNLWEVIEKNRLYRSKKIENYSILDPQLTGSCVLYDERTRQVFTSVPGSAVILSLYETPTGLGIKQVISSQLGTEDSVRNTFGESLALSSDGRWLIVGSPSATSVKNNYRGEFDNPERVYLQNDIVLFGSQLWKAKRNINPNTGDYSTISLGSDDWEPVSLIQAEPLTGRSLGFINQGVITIYENVQNRWENRLSIVSPRPQANELFGHKVAIVKKDNQYHMMVSAPGSMSNQGRVYSFVYKNNQWQHDNNTNYQGVYDTQLDYAVNSIVWYDNKLFQAQVNEPGEIEIEGELSSNWLEIDPVSTQNSLPTNVAIPDDSSIDGLGLLSENQIAELIRPGDRFGTSMIMSSDASILIIGAPNSSGIYLENYKGIWNSYQQYNIDDIIYYFGNYYRSIVNENKNQIPSGSENWILANKNDNIKSGKVFVYQKDQNIIYQLKQTISLESLVDINDTETVNLKTGDLFGYSLDLSSDSSTLIVSSPKSDIGSQDQGAVFVFRTTTDNLEYRLKQKLESFDFYSNEFFGWSISISPSGNKIVVGAKNTPFSILSSFDENSTTFDRRKTIFSDFKGFGGAAYVFERKTDNYFLTEKLQDNLSPYESFGYSVDCTESVIVAGSPNYIEPETVLSRFTYIGPTKGLVRIFTKAPGTSNWNILSKETPIIDTDKIKSISVYDNEKNIKIQDLDFVDPARLKILNLAEQEIKFKTIYDPATYTLGTDEQVVNPRQAWYESHVGEIWWDLSTAKWMNYQQGDMSYRVGNWNRLAEGASIDVYEWVETPLLPSEWSALADTNEGISLGISGQPLFPNDNVYSKKEFFNALTGEPTDSLYYFWVRNKRTLPASRSFRKQTASDIASLISNPENLGISYLAIIDSNKFLMYNLSSIMPSDAVSINFEYFENLVNVTPVHNEYQLLTENVADSLPAEKLETKWLDSLIGTTSEGLRVPDPSLPAKMKQGVSFRPRQSLFVNRDRILKDVFIKINNILKEEAFADTISFANLNSFDQYPSEVLNQYDQIVDNRIDLDLVGVARIRQAVLRANIINDQIDTIDIVDSGFGYKNAPPLIINGDGNGASAEAVLDRQGRIVNINLISRGNRYSTATVKVRPFSVLVLSDNTAKNFWSIYSWDQNRKSFFRVKTQSYDVSRYWNTLDWWKSGYSGNSKIVKEITTIIEGPKVDIKIGELIRIKEYGSGGWAIFEKINDDQEFFSSFRMVAREKGTIEFVRELYDFDASGRGYDTTQPFDSDNYDLGVFRELRIILKSIKQDIFVGDYSVEWNRLFFMCIRYAFSEQGYIDWAFKTSFLNAKHIVGELEQKTTYKNDSLDSFKEYINEVKPFRTTVREFVSQYNKNETVPAVITDFDLPARWSIEQGKYTPVTENDSSIQEYPWKWWVDNQGFSIDRIEVSDPGEGYLQIPEIIIEGSGGANAKAYISNGKVISIQLLDQGNGYFTPPTISIIGSINSRPAKAVAILGGSKVRNFHLGMKFDRLSKISSYSFFNQQDSFTAINKSAYDLRYVPTFNRNNISVTINDQVVLSKDYEISLFLDQNNIQRGRIVFKSLPSEGSNIVVTYEKNDNNLDSVGRIEKYYNPKSGMRGKDINQLMTGIDFGGVQIQGTTFDVTGGWDALPWFTDNWDSVESSADYYYIIDLTNDIDSSTIYNPGFITKYDDELYVAKKRNVTSQGIVILPVTSEGWEEYWELFKVVLPYVPTVGQEITIYLKKVGEDKLTRIDDPNFGQPDLVTNTNAVMPTFIGDGSTREVDIGNYINLEKGDTLTFRPIESDGAVIINDANILDTNVSGGSLSPLDIMNQAYSTATGMTSEEIVIQGGKFIDPDQVSAPEENVPGQVLESLSLQVFSISPFGAAPLQSIFSYSDGARKRYDYNLRVFENKSLMVFVDKVKRNIGTGSLDYRLDIKHNFIEFNVAPAEGSEIEIFALGIGGIALLDYLEFVADGETSLFLSNARFSETGNVIVTINGARRDVNYRISDGVVDSTDKTLIQFGSNVPRGSIIKIIVLGRSNLTGQPIVSINRQLSTFNGTTRSIQLENFVNLQNRDAAASMIVEINNSVLRSGDTVFRIYDGQNNQIEIGKDPFETPGNILISNIFVFVNDERKEPIQDYVFDTINKIVTVDTRVLKEGDEIEIIHNFRSQYSVIENVLTIENSVELNENDIITITWFDRYDLMKIVTDEFVGGKPQYKLNYTPLNMSYVWVYKNGEKLTQDRDFYVSLSRGTINLTQPTDVNDLIKVILFGAEAYSDPTAFEIYKDMLNVYQYKRFLNSGTTLTANLNYYDSVIKVSDASDLYIPNPDKNIPGVIYINGERIEYFTKSGNILGQLRRGSYGSSIAEIHENGTQIYNVSYPESLPYKDNQERTDFLGLNKVVFDYDGSSNYEIGDILYIGQENNKENIVVFKNDVLMPDDQYNVVDLDGKTYLQFVNDYNEEDEGQITITVMSLLIGPLDFTPLKSSRVWPVNNNSTIPSNFRACDQIEIFVAGRRLRKDPLTVYDELLGSDSPFADKTIDAEFAVDGTSNYIRLTDYVPVGQRITIIKKTGRIWYERGATAASTGKTLADNDTPVAKFIVAKTTKLPE